MTFIDQHNAPDLRAVDWGTVVLIQIACRCGHETRPSISGRAAVADHGHHLMTAALDWLLNEMKVTRDTDTDVAPMVPGDNRCRIHFLGVGRRRHRTP